MSLRVGVVTVTYRGGDAPLGWAAALREVARAAGDAVDLHAVAVDNASDDGTAERLRAAEPRLDVVGLEDNLGFAAGCNVGLARLDAPDVIALVNPDVLVDRNFLRILASLAGRPTWPRVVRS